jgi:choice-of-anchor C domain-containing protein
VKRLTGLGFALGMSAAIALSGATLAALSGPTNGSFEDAGTYVDNGSGFQQLDTPNTSIDGWSVDAGSVDWIGTYWAAQDGSMSIDMSGAEAGTLSQTFATTIGNTYTVSFYLSGNPAGPPTVKTLDVSATGGTLTSYTYDVTGNNLTTMNWTQKTYSFLATSASTTLSFISTTAGVFGPALDNVVITETIPTKDDCKQGGWPTMIDVEGNSFKNQGDCVSYFATKGKNLGALPPATVTDASAAAPADAPSAQVEQSTKKPDKTTGRQETEKKAAENKTKSHGAQGHGSNSKKPK